MCQDRSVQTLVAASPVAISTATSTDRTQNAVHAENCSTSYDCVHGKTPAMLQRKGAFNSRGQLLLKNLTYEELEQWCLQEGTSSSLFCSSSVVVQMQGSVHPGLLSVQLCRLTCALELAAPHAVSDDAVTPPCACMKGSSVR